MPDGGLAVEVSPAAACVASFGVPTIRRAVPSDRDELVALVESFYEVDGHRFDGAKVTGAITPLLVDDRHGQVWLVERDGEGPRAVGYAVVTWGWSLESGGLDSLLDEIYVEPRGSGIGAELLTRVKIEAARHGARVMALETEAPNERARRFYRRHGFVDEDSIWLVADLEPGTVRGHGNDHDIDDGRCNQGEAT